jgi:hypothetical protein
MKPKQKKRKKFRGTKTNNKSASSRKDTGRNAIKRTESKRRRRGNITIEDLEDF